MKKIYIRIEGMMCNHCYDTVTKTIQKEKNINKVKVKGNIASIMKLLSMNME